MKYWIEAARPKTLVLGWGIMLFTVGLVLGYDLINDYIDYESRWTYIAIGMGVVLSLLQVVSNFANDLGDAKKGTDDENRLGPRRMVSSGFISYKAMLQGIVFVAFISFILGVATVVYAFEGHLGWIAFYLTVGILAIITALRYTLGKRPLAYRGLGDIAVFTFFGIVPVLATAHMILGEDFSWWFVVPAVGCGCLGIGVLNMNNLRDIDQDLAHNKRTLITKLGYDRGVSYHGFITLIAFVSILVSTQVFKIYTPMLVLIMLVWHLKRVRHIHYKKDYNKELPKLALTVLLLGVIAIAEGIAYEINF